MLRASRILAITVGFLGAVPATQSLAQALDLLQMEELERRETGAIQEYSFRVEASGSGVFGVSLLNPQGLIVPVLETQLGVFESEISFDSFANRQAAFPNGSYQIFVNGAAAGSVDFDPVEADGFAAIQFPDKDETGLDADPTFEFSNGCSNCQVTNHGVAIPGSLELDLVSEFGSTELAARLASQTTSHSFGILLPEGEPHTLSVGVWNLDLKASSLGHDFIQISGRDNRVTFVPVVTGRFPGFCGDLDLDRTVSLDDAARYREALAHPVAAPLNVQELGRCRVYAPAGAELCDVVQVAALLRGVADLGLAPGIQGVCDDAPPDALGSYSGIENLTVFSCGDAARNGAFNVTWTLNVFGQEPDGAYVGVGAAAVGGAIRTTQFEFTLAPDGTLERGSYRFDDKAGPTLEAHGNGSLSGALVGDTLNLVASGLDQVGDGCVYNSNGSFTR